MNLISYKIDTAPTYINGIVDDSKYVTDFNGTIQAFNEKNEDVVIGTFDITSVDMLSAAANNDECLIDVIDVTQNTYDAAEAILDTRDYEPKKSIERQFDSSAYGSYAVVNSIKINDKWKNKNVDIATMFDFMTRYLPDNSLFMIEPKNKKHEEKLKKFKFKKIKGSNFYAFCNAYQQPVVKL